MVEREKLTALVSAALIRRQASPSRLGPLAAAIALAIITSFAARAAGPATGPAYDLLIRHGKVIDGAGNPWFYADVAVTHGRIAAVGDLSTATAKSEIDATNLIVAPGFIDPHTHADTDLYRLPKAENFTRDGVTTIVTGNCGSSVTDVAGYFDHLKRTGTAVNVATLIGHNSVRRAINGDGGNALSPEQIAKGQQLVRKAMQDGAVGFSTGLIYTPGIYSTTEEIIALAKPAAELGGIYTTHMRSESLKIQDAINEALRVGREAGCRVEISHFKLPTDVSASIGGSDTTLKMVTDARAAGQEVWLDQYPYTASSTSLSTLLPDWVMDHGRAQGLKTLRDPGQLPRVLADMRHDHETLRHRADLSYAVVASCAKHPDYAGKSVKTITQLNKYRQQRNQGSTDTTAPELLAPDAAHLPDVTMDEQYRTIIQITLDGGASAVFHSFGESDVANIMKNPLVSICSDSGVRAFGQGAPHPRGYGSNARVLGHYVRDLHTITLEDAIRKMTSQPATAFRLKDRGLVKEGYHADLVIFDPTKITDNATFEKPHAYSTGFRAVLVNGQPVVQNDQTTSNLPGDPVYGPAQSNP